MKHNKSNAYRKNIDWTLSYWEQIQSIFHMKYLVNTNHVSIYFAY